MVGALLAERYRLDTLLGEGGMGAVYLGTDERLRRPVAIKVIRTPLATHTTAVGRFLTEARASARLSHPGIVTVHDVGEHVGPEGRFPFLVMERIDGESLGSLLNRGPLSPQRAFDLGAQVLDALAVAHAAGIVHRDVKPENILIRRADGRATLVDFGVARMLNPDPTDPKLTNEGHGVGTPQYMAPEQIEGAPVGPAADLYAVGVTLYEAIVGRPLHDASSYAGLLHLKVMVDPVVEPLRQMLGAMPDARRFEPSYHALVAMVQRDPALRPRSAHEIAAVFRGAAAQSAAVFAPTIPTPEAVRAISGHAAARPALATPASASAGSAYVAGSGADGARPRGRPPWLVPVLALIVVAGSSAAMAVAHFMSPRTPPAPPRVVLPAVPIALPRPLEMPPAAARTLRDYREASGSARALLDSPEPWLRCAEDLAALHLTDDAPVRLRAAHAFCEGRAELARHQTARGLERIDRALALDPTWTEPNLPRAEALLALQRNDEAFAAARTAARMEPNWWLPEFVVGGLYARSGQGAESIAAYLRAAALAPSEAAVRDQLALAYHALGMNTDADRAVEEALRLDPSMPWSHLIRAERALERGDGEEALAEAERTYAVRPNAPGAMLARADALARVGRTSDAMGVYRELLALIGDDASTGLPEARLALVRAAVAGDRLPPPRHRRADTHATPARTQPPPLNGNRTRGCAGALCGEMR